MELIKKLSKIQRELVCEKNLYNNFGKYKYRNLESIFDSVKKFLKDELVVTINEDLVLIGDRFYIKAIASITDGKDSISATAFARESLSKKGQDDAMVTISTSSYASKSAMQKLFMLDDTSDKHEVDAQDNTATTKINELEKLIKETKSDKGQLLAYFKVDSLSSLSTTQEAQAFEMLNKKKG